MENKLMTCKKCGSTNFQFRWKYLEEDVMKLILCHDGIGFRMEDSIIKCSGCGFESPYEEEDFTEVK